MKIYIAIAFFIITLAVAGPVIYRIASKPDQAAATQAAADKKAEDFGKINQDVNDTLKKMDDLGKKR